MTRKRQSAVAVPQILLPQDCDMQKWSVVACDQFTSDRKYWQDLDAFVGEAPSALRLILPECYVIDGSTDARRAQISATMREYYRSGLFRSVNSMVFVTRRFARGGERKGLVAAVDLEAYDYRKGSKPLVRATEGTVLDRLPPRVAVRENSLLELPHIMLLIDDPENIVFGEVERTAGDTLYDFELNCGGGRICGKSVNDADAVLGAFDKLSQSMRSRYGEDVLMFVGDGNHSLAAAKQCYEKAKQNGDDTARLKRYALCEIVNLYDDGIVFEPIHRAVFGVDPDDFAEKLNRSSFGFTRRYEVRGGGKDYEVNLPADTISAIATVESFISEYISAYGGEVDYIHGDDVLKCLSERGDCITIAFPPIVKNGFTEYILNNGALPKKTFSMGHAEEKRYYLEARLIGKN